MSAAEQIDSNSGKGEIDEVDRLMARACRRVFQAPCVTDLGSTTFGTDRTLAVLGFWGDDCRGMLGLAMTLEEAIQYHPNPAALAEMKQSAVQSWVAELANLLVGQIKAELYHFDVDVWLSPPTVLRGVDVRLEPTISESLRSYRVGPTGWIWLDFQLDTEASELAQRELLPDEKFGAPGDVIVF